MNWMNETDEGKACYEELVQKRVIGKWSLFPDESSGEYLFFGMLLGVGDEFEGFRKPVIFNPEQIDSIFNTDVSDAFVDKLREMLKDVYTSEQYEIKLIVFSDWY